MTSFISCDWGTSNLRVRLVDAGACEIRAEFESGDGIARVFDSWKRTGGDRLDTFRYVLVRAIAALESRTGESLGGIPVVISGMASSSIGMVEVPYAPLPFAIDGSGLRVEKLPATEDYANEVLIISGVQSPVDAMRGEETQLVGAMHGTEPSADPRVFVLPGTHSKHIRVEGTQVTEIATYMTGEFFDLLSSHSILANSIAVPTSGGAASAAAGQSSPDFDEGVRTGADLPLLRAAFRIRTRTLLQQKTGEANREFLSGLLIGTELGALVLSGTLPTKLTVVASGRLATLYRHALRALGVNEFGATDSTQALIRGQFAIASAWRFLS